MAALWRPGGGGGWSPLRPLLLVAAWDEGWHIQRRCRRAPFVGYRTPIPAFAAGEVDTLGLLDHVTALCGPSPSLDCRQTLEGLASAGTAQVAATSLRYGAARAGGTPARSGPPPPAAAPGRPPTANPLGVKPSPDGPQRPEQPER